MTKLLIAFLSLSFYSFLFFPSANSEFITSIELESKGTKTVRGYLSEGRTMPISWANNSTNVNCFPAKNNKNYSGNQVLYTLEMPANSVLELNAFSNKDISMFAFQLPVGDDQNLPPSVHKVIYCEASSHKGNGLKNPEYIYLTSQSKSNKVVIGVAGVEKETMGAFELKMKLAPKKLR